MHNGSGTFGTPWKGRWDLVFIAFGLVLLFFINSAAAQGTASIIGQVTDQSGGVLPGVTVTATSPALQVPQVVEVTNEQGEYRLAPLPIGVYQVSYELAGFRPVRREDVRLTVGFIDNTKHNFDRLADEIGTLLRERYGVG